MSMKYLLGVSALALGIGFGGSAWAQNAAIAGADADAASEDSFFGAAALSGALAVVNDQDVDSSTNLDADVDLALEDNSAENSYNTTTFDLNATVAVADQELSATVSEGSSQLGFVNVTGDAKIGDGAFDSASGVINVPISTGLGSASANGVNIAATATFNLGN